MNLWNKNVELQFFKKSLRDFASPEKLFYKLGSSYYAYIPKNEKGKGDTLQSRNSLIGQFTEKWTKEIFSPIAKKFGLYAVNGVVCDEIGLSKKSNADLAICKTDEVFQEPDNIKLLFEIKMSIISNYRFLKPNKISLLGDYKTHKGNPSLLRSDSMLKAIGKSINIRVSGIESSRIPIVILGNSPIMNSYIQKVDFLKTSGVIQGFWSLNPKPTKTNFIKKTPNLGFQTINNFKSLYDLMDELTNRDMNYFSSMISKVKLGEYIRIANHEKDDESKAEKFLKMIRDLK